MSSITTMHDIDVLRKDFDVLLENIEKVIKERSKNKTVKTSKLWQIKKDLQNPENLDESALGKLIELVTKFNAINHIFSENIPYNRKDLLKIIDGTRDYSIDANDGYNDFFFELSMATRWLLVAKAYDYETKINLDGICDVIIDDEIAIECKYIHSSLNIIENVKKADKQIGDRVKSGLAKYGMAALDLSNICRKDRIKEFADYVLLRFAENYELLIEKGKLNGDVLDLIIQDRNFSKILNNYTMLEAETSLAQELGFDYKLGKNTLAIVFQVLLNFVFEYRGKSRIVVSRGMTYRLNEGLGAKDQRAVVSLINKLAVGI